ncbi:MAG: sporulation protein YunB [Oscillospiraceae bacterium]|nr:sporulation protein YunB [Oscillospiraceae bacterium]
MPIARNYGKKENASRRFGLKLAAIGIVSLIIFFIVDINIRPIIKTVASYRVQMMATNAINQAVYTQIQENGTTYEELVTLSRNNDGNITSIETNIANINKLNADISSNIIGNLQQMQTTDLRIPIGTLLGSKLLSGRGPGIIIKAMPTGEVTTKIVSNFSAAGINQTHHVIEMQINVTVAAMIPGYSSFSEVPSGYQIAETIIVGNVPDSFTEVLLETKAELPR